MFISSLWSTLGAAPWGAPSTLPLWKFLQCSSLHCGSSLLAELFIFPQFIHGLFTELDVALSGRLRESQVRPGTVKMFWELFLRTDSKPELAHRCLWLCSVSLSSPVCQWLMRLVWSAWGCKCKVVKCQSLNEDVSAARFFRSNSFRTKVESEEK